MSKALQEIHQMQRADGPAAVLAIDTGNPANIMYQAEFPDFYFRITDSEHLVDLKQRFTRICKLYITYFLAFKSFLMKGECK